MPRTNRAEHMVDADRRRRASIPSWIPIIISSCAARRVSDQRLWKMKTQGVAWWCSKSAT